MLSRLLKLMKFEFKCTYRSFGVIYLVILAASFFLIPSGESTTFGIIISLIYGASVGVLIVMNFVTIIKNFYTSMFQKTSYLTQTLPVKSYELIASKLIVSHIWMILSGIVLVVSTFIIAFQANNASFYEVMDIMSSLLKATLESQFWFIILYLIIVPMESILMLYFIMTVVHTKYVRRYRAFISVIIFFAINYLISKISFGIETVGFSGSYSTSQSSQALFQMYFSEAQAWATLGVTFLLGALFFAGTCYVLDHKLEIE